METTLLKTVFVFQRGPAMYTVEFSLTTKRWYIYEGKTKNKFLAEMPWNGIYNPPHADCAETVLLEYLQVDE